MKTTVINLFAGPSTGKTTLATRLFSELNISKPFGEPSLLLEYAKELIYQGRFDLLDDQPHVTGEQCRRLSIYIDNVDIVITDSPILLGLVYSKPHYLEETKKIIDSISDRVENINFFIERMGKEFDPVGRIGNISDAIKKDQEIKEMLAASGTPYHTIQNQFDIASVIAKISEKITSTKKGFFHENTLQTGTSNFKRR